MCNRPTDECTTAQLYLISGTMTDWGIRPMQCLGWQLGEDVPETKRESSVSFSAEGGIGLELL